MRMCILSGTAVLTTTLLAGPADAAVIAAYGFGTPGAETLAPTTLDANTTASNWTAGPHTTSSFQNTTQYAQPTWRFVNRNSNGAGQGFSGFYAEFTATANPGYELNLTSFSFEGNQGTTGATTNRNYAIYTSVDGLGLVDNLNIMSGPALTGGPFLNNRPAVDSNATMQLHTANLSDARFQGLEAITVRVYFNTWNSAGVDPTTGQNIDLDNFVLNGTVALVPEPAMLGLLSLGGLMLLRRR